MTKRLVLVMLLALGTLPARAGAPSAEVLLPVREGKDAYQPTAAFGSGKYLVAWQAGRVAPGDLREGHKFIGDIVACRVDASGKPLDAKPIVVCGAPDLQERPDAAFGGDVFLVAWQDLRNGKDWDVYAARVSPDGVVLDPDGILVAGGAHNQAKPDVAWDGKAFVVVWQDRGRSNWYQTVTARVSPGGKVLDAGGVVVAKGGFYHAYAPAVASAGGGKSFVLHIALGTPKDTYRAPMVQGWMIEGGKPGAQPAYAFDKKAKDARKKGPAGNGHPIAVAGGKGAYFAAWKNDSPAGRSWGPDKNAALFDAKGARKVDFVLAGATGKGARNRILNPDVVWDGSAFLVAWGEYVRESKNGCPADTVFAQRIGADGKPGGAPVKLSGTLASPAGEPCAATDGKGASLVAYEKHPAKADVPIKVGFRMLRN